MIEFQSRFLIKTCGIGFGGSLIHWPAIDSVYLALCLLLQRYRMDIIIIHFMDAI